jgi:hypothetical protein
MFSSLELKEKIEFLNRVGIRIHDVQVDTYDIRVSNDRQFVVVCRDYADCWI